MPMPMPSARAVQLSLQCCLAPLPPLPANILCTLPSCTARLHEAGSSGVKATSFLRQGNLDMVPDMVKQFVVYFYRHIRYVGHMHP